MDTALEFCARLATETTATPDLASLSEVDMLRRYPAIALGAVVLFTVGLACDLYLLQRFQRRPPTPLFKVEPKPWGLSELALAILAFLVVNLLVFLASAAFGNDDQLAWLFTLTSTLIMNVAFVAALPWLFARRGLDWRRLFGIDPARRPQGLGYGLVFYFAMIPPLVIVTILSTVLCQVFHIRPAPQPVVELLTFTDSGWMLGLVVLLAVVVAPVFEEILFRGFAYPALKQRWGTWKALVLVSTAFAVVHLHAPSIGPLFALGLAFALGYELTGSLLAPILMHSLFNGANVLMLLYVRAHS